MLTWAVDSKSTLPSKRLDNGSPTWSWASIEAQITIIIHTRKSDGLVRSGIEVVRRSIDLVDERAPFGQARSGNLTLKGRLILVACDQERMSRYTGMYDFPEGAQYGPDHFVVRMPSVKDSIGYCARDDSFVTSMRDMIAPRVLVGEPRLKEANVKYMENYCLVETGKDTLEFYRVGSRYIHRHQVVSLSKHR